MHGWTVYNYWLLMKGMVEIIVREVKFNLGLLFTVAGQGEQ